LFGCRFSFYIDVVPIADGKNRQINGKILSSTVGCCCSLPHHGPGHQSFWHDKVLVLVAFFSCASPPPPPPPTVGCRLSSSQIATNGKSPRDDNTFLLDRLRVSYSLLFRRLVAGGGCVLVVLAVKKAAQKEALTSHQPDIQ
jgi:hypothetical protein